MTPNTLTPADAIAAIQQATADPLILFHTEITHNRAGEIAEIKVIRIGRLLK